MKHKILNLNAAIFLAAFGWVVFSTAFATAEIKNPKQKSIPEFNKSFSGKAQVIDGDSLKVGEHEVRLFEIDAPEYHQSCLNKNNQKYECGKQSRDFLVKLANGKNLECFYAFKDKYERYLSKCYLTQDSSKVSINEESIKNGWSVIYDFSQSEEKMVVLEKAAQEKKLGIWQGAFQLPREYRKENPHK